MLKKIITFIIVLCIVAGLASVAYGAKNTVTGPWDQKADDGYPILIDRTKDPKAYSKFTFDEDAKLLEIWFANLRDADSTILKFEDQVWMIDCADNRNAARVTALLNKLGIKHIDKLINTHPHHDHLNGLFLVDDAAEIDELMICFPEDYNDHMIKAMNSCKLRDIKVTSYEDGDRMLLGDVVLDTLLKCDVSYSENDRSSVIRLQYGDRTMLFTADIENAAQKLLTEEIGKEVLDTDILKYPHHGKTALYEPFYEAVDPMFVLVFNYAKYGEAPYYLGCKHVPFAYSVSAYIHLVTDGKHWLAERVEKPEKYQ